tara:strand:+ start:357 stop:590 length:234 start_codon:yes stop_codon:yes gene_type:complete
MVIIDCEVTHFTQKWGGSTSELVPHELDDLRLETECRSLGTVTTRLRTEQIEQKEIAGGNTIPPHLGGKPGKMKDET